MICIKKTVLIMSSIRNITSSTPMPPDLAKKIGVSGVNEIMGVFWKGYRELKSDASFVVNALISEAAENMILLCIPNTFGGCPTRTSSAETKYSTFHFMIFSKRNISSGPSPGNDCSSFSGGFGSGCMAEKNSTA